MKIIFTTDVNEEIAILQISDADQSVIETDMINIVDWVENALTNKLRQVRDSVIYQDGWLAPRASAEEREQRIDEMIKEKSPLLKSAKQKNLEYEERLKQEEKALLKTKAG